MKNHNMRLRIFLTVLTIVILSQFHVLAQSTNRATQRLQLPVPQIQIVAQLPRFGEGVVFDRQGRLFVSDPFVNKIQQVLPDGEIREWATVNMANGHKVLADGTHVVMEQGENAAIAFLDANGSVIRRITQDDQGRRFRYPNDVTPDRINGGFYFTDPGEFMKYEPGRIFYVSPQGQVRTISDGAVDFPNGIVLRPDGQTLLVAESLQNRVLEFRVTEPGRIDSRFRIFAILPSFPNPWTNGEAEPDGMALDEAGNLYVAHFGAGLVHVLNPNGQLLGSLGTGSNSITNLAFGGADFNELYVYAANGNSIQEFERGGRIIRITLPNIRGVRLLPSV
jgi:gluconolactonase